MDQSIGDLYVRGREYIVDKADRKKLEEIAFRSDNCGCWFLYILCCYQRMRVFVKVCRAKVKMKSPTTIQTDKE